MPLRNLLGTSETQAIEPVGAIRSKPDPTRVSETHVACERMTTRTRVLILRSSLLAKGVAGVC
jgi:hypothetical protein